MSTLTIIQSKILTTKLEHYVPDEKSKMTEIMVNVVFIYVIMAISLINMPAHSA